MSIFKNKFEIWRERGEDYVGYCFVLILINSFVQFLTHSVCHSTEGITSAPRPPPPVIANKNHVSCFSRQIKLSKITIEFVRTKQYVYKLAGLSLSFEGAVADFVFLSHVQHQTSNAERMNKHYKI